MIRRTSHAACLVCLLAVACTALPEVDPNICGNRVIEEEEQCDTFGVSPGTACGAPRTEHACRFICPSGSVCPDGWRCGADLRCRKPTGTFEEPMRVRFSVEQLAARDFDGDQVPDLVGYSGHTISLLYGEGRRFSNESSFPSPPIAGALHYPDLDEDGLADVIMSMPEGLNVMRGQHDRSLRAVAYSPFSVPSFAFRMVPIYGYQITGARVLLFLHNKVQFFDEGTPFTLPGTVENLVDVPIANLDQNTTHRGQEFALVYENAGEVAIWTGRAEAGHFVLEERQRVALPQGRTVARGAFFGDFDGDGWTDLLISAKTTNSEETLIAYADAARPGFLESSACHFGAVGADFWPLAVADLNNDQHTDRVVPNGLLLTPPSVDRSCGTLPDPPRIALEAVRPWTEAVVGDFNGDHRPDLAALSPEVRGIFLYLGSGTGLFNTHRVHTPQQTRLLRSGDFDGDFILDVAFVAPVNEEEDELSVLFGTRSGRPPPPIPTGRFDPIEQLVPLILPLGDAATDLLVVSLSDDGLSRTLAIAHGNDTRRLFSPYFLTGYTHFTQIDPQNPIGVTSGHFCNTCDTTDCTEPRDLFVVAITQTTSDTRMWGVPGRVGTACGLDQSGSDWLQLPQLTSPAGAAGDFDGDAMDEVVLFAHVGTCDPNTDLVLFHFSTVDSGSCLPTIRDQHTVPGGYGRAKKVLVQDLDGDADNDLLVIFDDLLGPYSDCANSMATKRGVLVFWNEGGTFSAARSQALSVSGGALFDATASDLGSSQPEIVLLARMPSGSSGLYRARFDPASGRYETPILLQQVRGELRELITSDLDRDGLMDLVWSDTSEVSVLFAKTSH